MNKTTGLGPAAPYYVPQGTQIFGWRTRKGTKPTPRNCSVSDGWPTTLHEVDGVIEIFGDPANPSRFSGETHDL